MSPDSCIVANGVGLSIVYFLRMHWPLTIIICFFYYNAIIGWTLWLSAEANEPAPLCEHFNCFTANRLEYDKIKKAIDKIIAYQKPHCQKFKQRRDGICFSHDLSCSMHCYGNYQNHMRQKHNQHVFTRANRS